MLPSGIATWKAVFILNSRFSAVRFTWITLLLFSFCLAGCAHHRPAFYPSDLGRNAWKEKPITIVNRDPASLPKAEDSKVVQTDPKPPAKIASPNSSIKQKRLATLPKFPRLDRVEDR